MSDDDLRVTLARLDGRLDATEKGLHRAENVCERRASEHVPGALYVSERDSTRDQIRALEKTVVRLDASLKAAREEQAATRRWAVTTAVTIGVSLLATVVAVLT